MDGGNRIVSMYLTTLYYTKEIVDEKTREQEKGKTFFLTDALLNLIYILFFSSSVFNWTRCHLFDTSVIMLHSFHEDGALTNLISHLPTTTVPQYRQLHVPFAICDHVTEREKAKNNES